MSINKELRPARGSHTIAKPAAGKSAVGGKTRGGADASSGGLIKKLRKPIPPPTRVAEDERKYSRARERERSRGEVKDLKTTTVTKAQTEGTLDDRV
jgi:hypothetical protein